MFFVAITYLQNLAFVLFAPFVVRYRTTTPLGRRHDCRSGGLGLGAGRVGVLFKVLLEQDRSVTLASVFTSNRALRETLLEAVRLAQGTLYPATRMTLCESMELAATTM